MDNKAEEPLKVKCIHCKEKITPRLLSYVTGKWSDRDENGRMRGECCRCADVLDLIYIYIYICIHIYTHTFYIHIHDHIICICFKCL